MYIIIVIPITSILLFKNYLFIALLNLHYCVGFTLVLGSKGYSLAVEHGLLIVKASLVADHRF